MRGRLGYVLAIGLSAYGSAAETAPPVIVALTFDTSGSVGPEDRARARELALELLAGLPQGAEVAVLTFDDTARVVVERTRDPSPVREALGAARSGGRFTALHDALYDASRYLQGAPPARKAIVLLTDGRDENSALALDDGLAVATGSGIPVFAVGMGRIEVRTLRRIAKLTAGDYSPLSEAQGRALAERIAALPLPEPAPTAIPSQATPEPAPRPLPPPPMAAASRATSWLVLLLGLGAAAALLLVAWARRGPGPPPAAAAAASEAPGEAPPSAEPAAPETVVGKMENTEEYVEQTIVLSELPTLVVQGGPRSGQFCVLSEKTTTCIGRAKSNDIVLDDVAVSAQHCRVRFEGTQFFLYDLQSTNGTFVNEQRVTRHQLRPGDLLKLGESFLQFKMERRKA